jgi:KDO2-lipid IV(A) lauroyltransferase
VRRRNIAKLRHALRPAVRLLVWPLEGLALALFWAACATMSPERAAGFGARLARALGPRFHWHGRLRDNLAIALPGAAPERVEDLARAAWGSFGATLAEYARLGTIADRRSAEHVEIALAPEVEAWRKRSRPFVFVTAHLGNWEISAATARRLGLPLTVVYSRQTNPITDWLVQRRRRALGCRFLPADHSIRPLLGELRAGRSVGLLVDLRVESGEPLPLCGHETATTLVPARLALKFGCPLVPVRVERTRPAHLRVTLHDPVLPDPALAPEAQAGRMMAAVNAVFEAWIVARPHEWQCFQNRWPKAVRRKLLRGRPRREVAS